jgi:hypothetical protein
MNETNIKSVRRKYSLKSSINSCCLFCKNLFYKDYSSQSYCSDTCRFMSKVDISHGYGPKGDCWKWLASKYADGYGQFFLEGSRQRAHRVSVRLFKNIDLGISLGCHTCDTRDCVNPDHVFPGTDQENKDDCKSKLRQAYGERNYNAVLTKEQAVHIRDIEQGTYLEIAKRYGISRQSVSLIKRWERWKILP